MILYCFLFVTSISLQAFFGPNKETIEKWDELLYSENPARIKQYVQNHPDEIKYGLQRLNSLKDDKENKIAGNEMGPEDWKRCFAGAALIIVGGFVYCGIASKTLDNEPIFSAIEMNENIKPAAVISAGAIAFWEGIWFIFNSAFQKKYSQESIKNLNEINTVLINAQEKKK